jgi:hypothetical protein
VFTLQLSGRVTSFERPNALTLHSRRPVSAFTIRTQFALLPELPTESPGSQGQMAYCPLPLPRFSSLHRHFGKAYGFDLA